jgi:hypothetical protein
MQKLGRAQNIVLSLLRRLKKITSFILWHFAFYFEFYISKLLVFTTLQTSKYAHIFRRNVLVRTDQLLYDRSKIYSSVTNWRWTKPLQKATLGVYGLIITVLILTSMQATLALPDLFQTWNFATPANYNIDSGLETSGTSVTMKPQNYVTDANTAALYHFDESSGLVASDSSANGNNGTVNGGDFVAGNLFNGINLDSTNDYVSAPDSASLSLNQQNTIEAWTKLNSNLDNTNQDRRQAIVDKGDYQLYYDNETGKVTYELADDSADSWSIEAGNGVKGSWTTSSSRSVTSSTVIGTDVYVGLGNQTTDAAVWKWDGSVWTIIGGEGINNSWPSQLYEDVYSMTTDGTNLYVGLGVTAGDGEVWMWNGTTWTKIGGDGINNGWQVSIYETVWSLDYFGGTLYAGIGSSANEAEVWSWNGTTWTKIGGDSVNSGWTTNYEYVAALTNDGTNLYAGIGATANDAEVWSWNGTTWTKIGGDSVNSGWTTNYETVRSLRYFGGILYAGIGDTAGEAEVWSWDGALWTKIGGDGLAGSWSAVYEAVYSFGYVGTNLYAGLGNGNGEGEVWMWDGAAWTKIGGDSLNGSWSTNEGDVVQTMVTVGTTLFAGTYDTGGGGYLTSWDGAAWTRVGGQYVNKSWGFFGQGSIEVMQLSGDYLYAGMGNTTGSAQVWQFDGNSWVLVGGQGVNGSWSENTYENIASMSSHQGNLYVGLGSGGNEAEVWMWNGTTWSMIGGDSMNSGWAANYEEVNSLASFGGILYAGIGNSNNDAEVWSWNGTTWTKIGGDSVNSGWTTNYDRVSSLGIFNGELIAGLGAGGGEAEVWSWNGTTWTKIGGDSVNSSWDSSFDQVEAMIPYDNKLFVGLGTTAGDGEVWMWDGTIWTKVGGDDLNGSWADGTYERVRTLAVYNGDLYAGLGSSTSEGEVWRYAGGLWSKVGGNSLNDSWGNTIEEVESFSAYKGKLYAGTGNTANADGNIWSIGNNGYLQSNTSSFDTNWRHIAATYDGVSMKIFIDGVEESSTNVSLSIPDGNRGLLIGNGYGGREYGKPLASFNGIIDEVRISNIARTSFNSKPYLDSYQAVSPTTSTYTSGVEQWDTFAANETLNGGSIQYRLSDDAGANWKYWDGASWVISTTESESNTQAVITAHMDEFPVTFSGFRWQALLKSDGNQAVTLNSINIEATSDLNAPVTNASAIVASKVNGGANLAQNDWSNGGSPYFSWTAGADSESGVLGYCAYLGTDNSADPVTTAGLLGVSPVATGSNCQFITPTTNLDTAIAGYLSSPLTTSSSPYYLTLKTIDYAGNVSAASTQFYFRFDNTPPQNPGFVSAPSGFVSDKAVPLTWPTSGPSAPSDPNSGLAGLQYRIDSSPWYGDVHNGSGDMTDLLTNDGAYTMQDPPDFANLVDGINTVYFRAWDQAGNVTTTYTTATIKLNTSGSPSEPQTVQVSPSVNTTNAFGFTWAPPLSFVGDVNNITYCYTINTLPSSGSCSFTGGGVTSLGTGPYATQPGLNTFYIVARDESNNVNYASYSSVTFTANTPSPGIPVNVDIVDVSVKATSNWRLALTWDQPVNVGAGVANYRVYRSADNLSFSQVGSSSSTTYIDAGLNQQIYYYYVIACDNTNNCGADSAKVSDTPTGKFTSPAVVTAEPVVTGITTKKATISWSTDRASDSRISLGTTSGSYSPAEVANSDQVTAHTIQLDNLSASTTYYFVAKWTDEDGNIGTSQEYSFVTAPAPTIKEVTVVRVSLTGATIQFTSRDATKVDMVYGKSEAFGGIVETNTSLAESTYTIQLNGLDDGSKYFFKLVSYDSENNSYDGNIFSFTTPPRPRINNLRFQPIEGEPTSTQSVTWNTNVPANTIVTYGKIDTSGIDAQSSELVTNHEIIIRNLEDDSDYFLIAQSRDADGNLAISDRQTFRTALDTRPPKISDITIETSIRGTGAEARGQVVVSWKTDEPATSQVGYADGSNATTFNNKTSEDGALGTEHIVIVSDLPTSRVYSIQPISVDKSDNEGVGETQTAIVGRASDSVLTIILNTLQGVFGF